MSTVAAHQPPPRPGLELTDTEQDMRDGREGPAVALAMRIVTGLAAVVGATRLLPVTSAHIDSCLYHGQAGLDFAERLIALDGRVAVPTTLNVGSLDLLHPELVRAGPELAGPARRLMDAYVELGATATWTCAPYQLAHRPGLGEDVAWAESNAIVFANSVLGARTDRYGDFVDICAALTARVPDAGLHRTENRRGQLVVDVRSVPSQLLGRDVTAAVLGHLVGQLAGVRVPVLHGLPAGTTEDQLKALGAAAASSGGVALFHATGITPEAPTLAAALQGGDPEDTIVVTAAMLAAARAELSTVAGGRLDAVSVGTPHFSLAEFGQLAELLAAGPPVVVDFYVSTSRFVRQQAESHGWLRVVEEAGVRVLVDTCTYITPVLAPGTRVVMTNSGKWAYYAPGNLGVQVVFGGLDECVASAREGRVVRDDRTWLAL